MSPSLLRRIALASLIALMLVSAAFVVASFGSASHGFGLAGAKLLVLGFLFRRVARGDTYTMQWSSMLILLFMAEGAVRATSDAQPSAALGALEAVFATLYFLAALGYLRPHKQAAKLQSKKPT
ncbi:MAG: DUF2069 domain-containing protein [Burkholderiaceae bacterium]